MNTSNTTLRSPAFLVVVGLASLLGSVGGCIIDAKIGDDPLGGSEDTTAGETESVESTTTTTSAGYTSGAEPGNSGTATAAPPSEDDGGSGSSVSATGAGPSPGVDQDTALEQCGVVVVPPEPGGPLYQEGIECELGCSVDLESGEPIGLYDQGQCVCDAMACGELGGGTTGELPGDTDGEPDGCGPFPVGDGGFTCVCEMCSIDVTNVDATWVEDEADLNAICECMCGGAGC